MLGTLVLTGSSAAASLKLGLAAPDTIDAYIPARSAEAIVEEYGLEPAAAARANVMLRLVPDEAWVLSGRAVAPRAAVGIDLAGYADPRSARAGAELLARLDVERTS